MVHHVTISAIALWLLLGCSRESAPTDAAAEAVLPPEVPAARGYVGAKRCASCHADQYAAWQSSHHDLAMQPANPETVLGDFGGVRFDSTPLTTLFSAAGGNYRVTTDNDAGVAQTFEVAYTFGAAPLQQYLLRLPGGRLQAFSVAWDSRAAESGGQRWFHLHPQQPIDHTDVLHWTAPSQNWNRMCADCHSTAVRKNYDAATRTYATSYAEVNVACEACHGPGSAHVEAMSVGTGTGQSTSYLVDLGDQHDELNACAPCHSRRSQIAEGFTPGQDYYDYYRPALLSDGLYYSDGQILEEVYVYGSFLQSRMYAHGVSCSDCHDPHSARLKLPGNALCTQCHDSSGRADFPTLKPAAYDDPAHHFHPPGSTGAACVACHMPARTYMQVDVRRDHGFRRPRPDLSASIGVPNACNVCHGERSAQWAAARISEHFGADRGEQFASTFHAARRGQSTAEPELAAIAGNGAAPSIVRATALALMQPYDRTASAEALRAGLADPDPLVVLGALAGSERWEPDLRWRRYNKLLDASSRAVRIEAARLLVPALPALGTAQRPRLLAGIDEYMAAQRLHADWPEAQSNIASVHLQLGNYRDAESALDEALRLNDRFVPALLNLADLYRASGRDREGGMLLERALALLPESPRVLLARGLWLVRQHRQDDALPVFARAFEAAPGPRTAYVYAIALNSSGRPGRSLEILDAALARSPGNRQLLEAAAAIARDSGDAERSGRYRSALQRP